MFTVPWNGSSALALILTNGQAAAGRRETETALRAAENENRELKSILDAATDGVITLDRRRPRRRRQCPRRGFVRPARRPT